MQVLFETKFRMRTQALTHYNGAEKLTTAKYYKNMCTPTVRARRPLEYRSALKHASLLAFYSLTAIHIGELKAFAFAACFFVMLHATSSV